MIVGRFVKLVAVEQSDIEAIVRWRNDPDVYRWFFEHEPLSVARQEEWIEEHRGRSDEKLLMISTLDGKRLGTIGLVDIDWRSRKAEWGRFFVGESEYRMGAHGPEAEFLLLQYAFLHLNLNKLYCRTFTFNDAVVSMHRRFGFRPEGVLRQHVYRDGVYEDVAVMGLLRNEFKRGEKKLAGLFARLAAGNGPSK